MHRQVSRLVARYCLSDRPQQRTLTITLTASTMMDRCNARADRSRERNRAAQKRYRDRQRSRLAEREDQLAALTEKLSLVLNEKVRCRARESTEVAKQVRSLGRMRWLCLDRTFASSRGTGRGLVGTTGWKLLPMATIL